MIETNPRWINCGVFVDDGISGTGSKKRPAFEKMMRACRNGKIDLILVKSISRFYRNTMLGNDCIDILLKHNVSVIFEKEGINTGEVGGRLLRDILLIMAQAESENIGTNVKWGYKKGWGDNKAGYQFSPYGYQQTKDGQLEIVEAEAEVVREIYHLYSEGLSVNDIIEELYQRRVPSPKGHEKWSASTVLSRLNNEIYFGDVWRQKTYSLDSITQKRKVNNGELAKYYFEDHHPPIVDRALFALVQEEFSRRKKKKAKAPERKLLQGRYSGKYELSNLIVCGECGCRYYRCHWRGSKIVWRCNNRLKRAKNCARSPTVCEQDMCGTLLTAITKYMAEKDIGELLHAQISVKVESAELVKQKLDVFLSDIELLQRRFSLSVPNAMQSLNRVLRMTIQSIQVLPDRISYVFHDGVEIAILIA